MTSEMASRAPFGHSIAGGRGPYPIRSRFGPTIVTLLASAAGVCAAPSRETRSLGESPHLAIASQPLFPVPLTELRGNTGLVHVGLIEDAERDVLVAAGDRADAGQDSHRLVHRSEPEPVL